MPSDRVFKASNTVHRALVRFSGGRMGWVTGKMPVLVLTTTGRRSGEPRTVMLTTPHQEGDTIVVVASKAGGDGHPAWFLNLRDDPEVDVETRDEPKHKRTARIATSEERARLWPIVVEKYSGYGGYQDKTEREIPLVLLDPARA